MRKSTEDIASGINSSIIDSINKDITNSRIDIPDEEKNLNVSKVQKSRAARKNEQRQQNKLHEILRKKKQLELQLNRMKLEESSVREKRVIPMAQSDESRTKYFRSTMTAQQKMKISQIRKETKRFEKEATEKTKTLLAKIQKLEKEQKSEREQRQRQLSERKKQQALEKIEEIKRRKEEREKTIKQCNKTFQKVSKQKFLHDQIDNNWKIVEASEEEENEKLLLRRKEEKKFNIDEIKAHSRRYSQIVSTHKLEREQNTKKIREDLVQKSRMSHYPSSTFFKTISEEEEMKRRQLMDRTQQPHIFKAKKKNYSSTVRELNNKPDVSNKNSSPPHHKHNNRIDIRSSQSLNNLGKFKLGNEYMKNIHSSIKDVPLNSYEISQVKKKEDKQVFKYPDYLTETRRNREIQNPEHESVDVVELRKMLNKKNEDEETKLFRAKLIISKLDEKAEGNSKNLVDSINAKLSIIQKFSRPLQ